MVRAKNWNGDGEKEWKIGSLQKYVPNQKWLSETPKVFTTDQVQRLSLIDMRFGNKDRHIANILKSNINGAHLIPIDHGECFPKECDTYTFVWAGWNQAKAPYPDYMVEYVKSLNVETDLQILNSNGIELGAESVLVYKIQNMVLKTGVIDGYLPYEIGEFMLKAYGRSTRRNLSQVVEQCKTLQRAAGIHDENKFLELICEKTKIALDFNRSLRQGST